MSFIKSNVVANLNVILSEGVLRRSLFDHLATRCLSGHDPRTGRRISFCALFVALIFAACDDSTSAASSDPVAEISSSSGDKAIHSRSSEDSIGSSSSATLTDDEKSSSSVEMSKSSSSSSNGIASNSSSSRNDEKSSSSSVKPSSSDAKSSSSEEVKQSSSSVVASSSSVAEQSSSSSFDKAFKGSLWRTGAYKAFVDPRDNREYYYIEIAGEDTAGNAATIKVMAENLNVGEFVWGFEDQEDDSKIERYCYKNDTANCNKYGGLYQWAEMMQLPSECNTKSCADLIKPNHQGICPDGWRLLTYNDFYIVVHADGNVDGPKGTRSAYGFGGNNDTGYSLVGAGYLWNHVFEDVGEGTYWHYPAESDKYGGDVSKAGRQWTGSTSNPYDDVYKTQGFSVRCVMVE